MTRRALLLTAAALLATAAGPAAADFPTDARARVATLVATVHDALGAGAGAERDDLIREEVADAFALDLWRRAVLGERAAEFSDAQLAEIDAALPGYMAKLYVDRFAGAAAPRPEVGEPRAARGDALVPVTMFRPDAEPLPLQYRVRTVDGAPQVLDVIVGGVSFALLRREEFRAMIDRGGPEALVAHIRENAL